MTYIAPSELIINADGSAFHIHIKPCELADRVILVGDPLRVEVLASLLDTIEVRGHNREFVFCTGTRNHIRITILSTGIGTDNIDIVINELDALANIDFRTRKINPRHRTLTILRVGTSGSIQDDIPLGTLVYSNVSLGFDGLINWYAHREAVSDTDMEEAFIEHMQWPPVLARPYMVPGCKKMEERFRPIIGLQGITVSAPGFYGPQGRVLRLPLLDDRMLEKLRTFRYEGMRICNFEMEGSAIAGLCKHLGHDYGTLCLIIAQRSSHNMNVDYKPLMAKCLRLIMEIICA